MNSAGSNPFGQSFAINFEFDRCLRNCPPYRLLSSGHLGRKSKNHYARNNSGLVHPLDTALRGKNLEKRGCEVTAALLLDAFNDSCFSRSFNCCPRGRVGLHFLSPARPYSQPAFLGEEVLHDFSDFLCHGQSRHASHRIRSHALLDIIECS